MFSSYASDYWPPYSVGQKLITFAVVPIEFVVACDSILNGVKEAVKKNTPLGHRIENLVAVCQKSQAILRGNHVWPLVFDRESPLSAMLCHIEADARWWLKSCSIFNQHHNNLEMYLQLPSPFQSRQFQLDSNGLIIDRIKLIGVLQRPPQVYLTSMLTVKDLCSKEHMDAYQEFLTMLVWMELKPRARMIMGSQDASFVYNPVQARW